MQDYRINAILFHKCENIVKKPRCDSLAQLWRARPATCDLRPATDQPAEHDEEIIFFPSIMPSRWSKVEDAKLRLLYQNNTIDPNNNNPEYLLQAARDNFAEFLNPDRNGRDAAVARLRLKSRRYLAGEGLTGARRAQQGNLDFSSLGSFLFLSYCKLT